MKAVAAIEQGRVAVVDIPMPEYGEYECLVKTTACGLCSSTDLKLIGNHVAAMDIQYPTVLGHEGVGTIVETGRKVRYFKAGDRVVNPSGRVKPESGFHANWAQMAEYAVAVDLKAMIEDGVPLRHAPDLENFPTKLIPDDISDVDAAMLITFKENYSALKNFGLQKGMKLLIFGDGAVAQGLSIMAHEMGAGYIGVVGHHDERLRRIASHAPIDLTVNARTEDVREKAGDTRFDLVIDGVGSTDVILEGAKLLRPFGRVGCYGVLNYAKGAINLVDLPNNVMLQMLNWPYREHATHDEIVALVRRGVLRPADFYSHVLPVDRAPEGVELIRTRQAYKVIIDFAG